MHHLKGSMPTSEPSRHLTRLCNHFRKKTEVEYNEQRGLARFPWGDCHMAAQEDAVDFECSAISAEQLERVQHVIDEHVALFSRKSPIAVQWQPPRID